MNTRLNNTKHTSLNESIAYVNSPQRELDEAVEYALALEEVLLALCEELGIDPNTLVEDIQTYERDIDMKYKRNKLEDKRMRAWHAHSDSKFGKYGQRLVTQKPTQGEKNRYKKARAADKALVAHNRLDRKEKESPSLYGKGGKIVK